MRAFVFDVHLACLFAYGNAIAPASAVRSFPVTPASATVSLRDGRGISSEQA